MALPFYNWSRTAASNASADSTVNWAEGQVPSSVNDSARAMMASTAAWRDDISGAIVTAGTSTAYTVSSYQVFDSLAHMSGAMIAFTPHATNGSTVTLNVDSLGAKPLRSAPSTELVAGTLIQGTPYVATYNNSDAVWYLQSFYGNPYSIPLGGVLPFFLLTAPNSSFVFPYGQTISRTVYSTLFALMSTQFGAGDGTTTFGLPDLRGRVIAGKDNMGGVTAGRLTTASGGAAFDGTILGGQGGVEGAGITQAQLPSAALATAITESAHHHTQTGLGVVAVNNGTGSSQGNLLTTSGGTPVTLTGTDSSTGITASTALGGSGSAISRVQPTYIANFIMRII